MMIRNLRTRVTIPAILAVLGLVIGSQAQAQPAEALAEGLGGQLAAAGTGAVTVTVGPSPAFFESELWFLRPDTHSWVSLGITNRNTGTVVNIPQFLGVASFAPGTPMLFGIKVNEAWGSNFWAMGPERPPTNCLAQGCPGWSGTYNVDGRAHAVAQLVAPLTADVGFEDVGYPFGDFDYNDVTFRFTNVYVTPLQVRADVKPGSDPNSINLRSNGNVPVAVFGGSYGGLTLDARLINRESVRFAGAPALPIGSSSEDINRDGVPDMVFHFDTKALISLTSSSTQACLTGTTSTGIAFEGCDSVRVIR